MITRDTTAALLCIAATWGTGACSRAPLKNPWSEPRHASHSGPSGPIGSYSAGCLGMALALPPDGKGYQLMRLTRGRFFGHASLLRFIESLGARAHAEKFGPVLVGDLGQPRGGPTLTGHKSHQNGLDADIWYWHPSDAETRSLRLDEREELAAPSVLVADRSGLDPEHWGPGQDKLLAVAAQAEEVERIFVTPHVKKHLCAASGPEAPERPWLRKIRPWWGHDDHFHVRLRCPADEGRCKTQEAAPSGDGCDATLDWWFSEEARARSEEASKEAPPSELPELPPACGEVLRQ